MTGNPHQNDDARAPHRAATAARAREPKRWPGRWLDRVLACALGALYFALLWNTLDDLGYARDEGFYVQAATRYASWFKTLFSDPSRAIDRDYVDSIWNANREHPGFIKSLFALSYQYPYKTWQLFSEEGRAFRFPAIVLSAASVSTVYLWGSRLYGRVGAVVAAVSFAMMPRVFYHSHLICFDMPVVAMWTFTGYAYFRALAPKRYGWALLCALLYGLLLNTKHNAWLMPFALVAHAAFTRGPRMLRLRWRAPLAVPLALPLMALLGPIVFYYTWPWIWNDTFERFWWYVKFHTGHSYYNMEFLGTTYFKPPMPRLYAWVMTWGTVPAITLALFCVGVGSWLQHAYSRLCAPSVWRHAAFPEGHPRGERTAHEAPEHSAKLLWLSFILVSYGPWTLSTTPIFGGTKHWMTAYPFLALFAGAGFTLLAEGARRYWERAPRRARAADGILPLCAIAAPIAITLHSHPWGLSAYTPLVGGAPGAASLGLNRGFWGYTIAGVRDAINERAPRGARIFLDDTAPQSWELMRREGRVRKDLHGVLSAAGSQLAVYHHEQHMQRVEHMIWVDYGTLAPVAIGHYDGVPIAWLYERPHP